MELEDGPQPEGYGAGRAATILVAECVGTGVLALPYVASVLGTGPFLLFVAVQVLLNLYAGELLATAAETAERKTNYEACRSTTSALWDFVDDTDNIDWDTGEPKSPTTRPRDMLELAQGLDAGRPLRALVASAWYGNLVLILAQYLVVMARSLRVAFPLPGCAVVESLLIAALTAWLIAQLPTLDALGKGAAQLSFASVVAILAICAKHTPTGPPPVVARDASAAAVAASLTTVTFAMITSKLFLNVRREMRDPREARKTLRYGIFAFTVVYIVVVFLSGPEPPRFLLDSVGRHSTDARVAAALLFCHVAVSYAINQNVLARTLERYLGHSLSRRGWALMTAALTLSSLLIAILVPVFSDMVAVIGALTSGPLGFAMPALLFDLATRDSSDVKRRRKGVVSLVLFTVVLTIVGTTGAITRTVKDWEAQERSAPGVRGFFCAEQASSSVS